MNNGGDDKPGNKAAKEACEMFPDIPSRTLARMLRKERPLLFRSIEQARDAVRYARGNRGKNSRRYSKSKLLFRDNGKAGVVTIPEPVVESWEPLVVSGPARIGVLSDIHVPYHDGSAVEVAVKECKRHGCDTIILNGDTIDFYGISRFEKDPERRSPGQEIRDTVQMLRWIQSQFPKARLIWKDGNHDERWAKYCWQNAPVLWQLQQVRLSGVLGYEYAEQTGSESTKLEKHGWEYLGDKRPILAGRLPILHGHEINATSPVNPARGAWLRTSHTVLIGHLHTTSQHTQPDLWHDETATWSTGCLCGLRPLYAPVNKWNHGFAICDLTNDGEFDLRNLRITRGKVRAS